MSIQLFLNAYTKWYVKTSPWLCVKSITKDKNNRK